MIRRVLSSSAAIICVIAVGVGEEVAWHSLCGADFDFAIERKMMVKITVTAAIPFLNRVTGRLFFLTDKAFSR